MKLSRTVLVLIIWLISFLAKQFFGIDIPLVDPTDPEGDGFTLMEVLNILLPILAAFFRVKATQKTTLTGIKTGEPLG